MNQIPNLPRNVFDRLTNLRTLYMYNNQIRELTVDSFGSSLGSLRMLYVIFNQISAIDPTFIDNANNLDQLYMSGNLCSDQNFIDIQDRLQFVRNGLQLCTNNYLANHIRCVYTLTNDGQYVCNLEINNPLGRDAFTDIDGEHLPGRTNADVDIINIVRQNTRNIPSILCEQFPNARSFIAVDSNIEFLYDSSFAACRNLTVINLWSNLISEVPANTFVHNPLLNNLLLGSNRIERLNADSFSGTAIEFLDISNNNLDSFDPDWFNSINDTLRTLDLLLNNIQVLPADAFRTIRDLEILILSFNPLRTVPPNAFIALDLLEVLGLINCGLRRLDSMWFIALRSLRQLSIGHNEIDEFEFDIFGNLINLQNLNFRGNYIWELNSDHFGSSIKSITSIDGANNLINVLNPVLVTDAAQLNYLTLQNNLCVNQDFTNVNSNTWLVLEYLSECSNNLVSDPTASCEYNESPTEYLCTLSSQNPRGLDEFTEISGNHLPNRNNGDVSVVFARNQNMRNIPSVLCRQFENVIDIMIIESNVRDLTVDTFAECRNLEYLVIEENFIRMVPHNMLLNNRNLHYLSLAGNLIANIENSAFVGTTINFLDVGFNRLTTFDTGAFERINGTLTTLDVIGNQIRVLGERSFDNIRGLEQLILNQNPLGRFQFIAEIQLLTFFKLQVQFFRVLSHNLKT
jgi:Leucine-rich repeat (LRR) protein